VGEIDQESRPRGPSLRQRGCGLIGCLLIIVVFVGLGAGFYFGGRALEPLADRFLWAPHEAVSAYFEAYRMNDLERAQRLLCDGVDGLLNPAAPFGRESGSPYVDDQFPYPRPGGRIGIYYRIEFRGDRGQALVEREDDGWRICEFVD
jgi:hypothetical protein